MGLAVPWRRTGSFSLALAIFGFALLINLASPRHAGAVAALAQTPNTNTGSGSTFSVSYGSTPTAGDLLVVICSAAGNVTITASGYTAAKNEGGSSSIPSQGIFYKNAAGNESSVTCGGGGSSTKWGEQLFDYKGIVSSSPLDAVNSVSSSGTSTTPASGSVTTTNANDLVLAVLVSNTGTALSSTWGNSFAQQTNFIITSKMAFGAAQYIPTATGTYSTSSSTGSSSAGWRGQIVSFKESAMSLSADMVDGSGNSVASPSIAMTTANRSFACQTIAGTLGVSSQKPRVNNSTANSAWTLSMAATGGSSATWTAGTNHYKFNDPTGTGCTNGQLTVNPSVGTIAAQTGCTTTGVSKGSSTAYSSGVTDSVTIESATASASSNCYWDITGVSLSQDIPASQASGSYSIGMTLTITAN